MMLACYCLGQAPADADPVLRIGDGVTPPKLIRKVEPQYSRQARDAHVQGAAVFEIVIDRQGMPVDITLVSPLGFGLDERAQAAIEQWRFKPGTKDGKPVKIRATVQVNFRVLHGWFDAKAEKRRTQFNLALRTLDRRDPEATPKAVKTIQDLSLQNYPPAMYLEGVWLTDGDFLPKDPDRALQLFTKAADKNYGPAIFELGKRRMDGRGLAADPEAGIKSIHEAAVLGSTAAQFYLGSRYERGDGVPPDLDWARRYFRLCAAAREAACQFKLGQMLLMRPDRREHDYIQAIAWLQLASDQGFSPARDFLNKESPRLTATQIEWADKLRAQLTRR